MKIGKDKTKRIILSLILCGCMSSTAHAEYTYDWDDYTDKVTATDATYTYTDGEEKEHDISYKTAEVETPDTDSITVENSFTNKVSGETYADTYTSEYDLNGTTFTVEYGYDSTVSEGIKNEDGSYIENVTGTFKDLDDFGDTTFDYAGGVYNSGEGSTIGNITAGFIDDGESGFPSHSGGTREYGGAVYNGSGAIINSITNSYFMDNYLVGTGANNQYVDGGAIYNEGTIDTISGSYFIGNSLTTSGELETRTDVDGGAICNIGTIIEISGSYFINNTSTGEGGAIGNHGYINSISNSYFIGNTSGYRGGAIYSQSSTSEIGTISGSYFIGNTAAEVGGAIYITSGSSASGYIMNGITESYFIENSAGNSGGAIGNHAGESIGDVKKSYFIGNTAGEGGAIYSAAIGELSGSYFIGNQAEGNGGAIYDSRIETLKDSYFIGNESGSNGAISSTKIGSISNCYFLYNVGDAIYNGPAADYYIGSIKESYFIENTGYAIYCRYGSITGGITDSYFINNGAADNAAGTLYVQGAEIGEIKGSYFVGNTGSRGGAIYLDHVTYDTSIAGITDSYFVSNTAGGSTGGGAIYSNADIGGITGSYFLGNRGASGGAINTTGTVSAVKGSYFIENEATTGNGGAIYNNGTLGQAGADGNVTGGITDTYFLSNTAEGYGGAIASYHNGSIGEISSTEFMYNKSGSYGGAIANRGGIILEITGSDFTENAAGTYGGAIANSETNNYNSTGIGSITATFAKNTAVSYGGAIANENARIGSIKSTFTGNSATGGDSGSGGAIANFSGSIIESIDGSYFEENTAAVSGGAIYNGSESAVEEITGSTFTKNTAAESGGAIYNEGELTSVSSSTTFTANTATVSGGAIYNAGTIGDLGSTFTSNTALAEDGGAIYNEGEIDNISSTFTGNTGRFGGAIYNSEEGSINGINGAKFETNRTDGGRGGAIYNAGSISTVSGSEFSSNETDFFGGAIYNSGSIETISDTSFSGNKTETAGGAIHNSGTIGIITASSFTGNTIDISDEGDVAGGAIYNTATGTITGISGGTTFSGNYVAAADGTAKGGSLYNAGTISEISLDSIEGSYAKGTTAAAGGAIYDEGTVVLNVTGNIANNYAEATAGEAQGGAIYSEGTIDITAASLTGNYAESTGGEAAGGAIYNAGTGGSITVTGDVTGNYVQAAGGNGAAGGAIYTENGSTITIGGAVSGNYAQGAEAATGGAIAAMDSSEITVTGAVSGNYALSSDGDAAGGAISSAEGSTITITGDVTGNYAEGGGSASGGAVFNMGDLTVTGSITDNYAKGGEDAVGGAIASMDSLTVTGGDIAGNYAEAAGDAQGGAIYNEGTLTVTADSLSGNYVKSTGGNAAGGAVYSDVDETTSITVNGAVSGNYATSAGGDAGGGAIYTENEDAVITITGDVTDNYATTTADGGSALGGAIYSQGTTTVTGAITGNYVEASDDAGGGAIYNEGTLTLNATSIENNHAISSAGAALAGAIYTDSEDSVINVTGNVTGNYVKAEAGEATGGAIYSLGTTTIEGDVTGNYAEGADVQGGAIYAGENSTVNLYGNITGNYAKGDTAKGGAIYNADGATVNIYVENKDSVISGNYTESGGTKEANVLYGEAGSVTNFNLTDATLRLDDSLNGETGFEVNISGNGVDATTFYMYNDILDSNLSFSGTTLNTINNEVKTYSVNKFTVAGDFNMVADVDLANESMDRFVTNGNNYGEAKGSLNVAGMNLISDTEKDRVGIYFAEPGLKEDVTSSVGQLPGSEQQTVYTPLYQYDVTYDKNYDGSWGDDGGYFVFDKQGNNPAAMVPTIAQMGLFNAMNMMFEYCFEHSDYYMKLPSETRLAIREKAKAARAAKLAAKNGTTVEEETKKIEDARAEEMASREGVKFYDHDNVLPLYDQHELTRPGAWVKPFATKESIPFTGKFTARDKYYGALIGVDSDFREDKKGWGNVFTGYAGYQGIHQSFSGGSVRQDGGLLGATETFYKKNFYTAWTIAAASTRAKARNMYGHESSRLYTYGIASKSGWNLEYDDGKYIVLPTFMVSYTNVDMRSYTNAAGLRVDADDMRAVQLNPNIKWIRNYDNGWQPYLTAGEIWTVGQKSRVRVDGTELDKLHLRPYTEYGIGVQKRWANEYDGYAEFLGHAGGRRGFLAKLGFRWTFN